MTVDPPRGENTLGEAIFTGPSNVIHDFVTAIFHDCVANTRGERVESFIPRGAFPFSFTAFSRAFEWVKNAIRIRYLVECGRTFGAVASTRAGVFRIPLEFLNLAGDFVDVSKQSASRFAIETGGGN